MTSKPGFADPENALVPFGRFDRLHVARFLVIKVDTWADLATGYGVPAAPFPAHLAFLGDVDGDRDSFLQELARDAGDGLRRIFAFCEDFPGSDDLASWMRSRHVREAANYVNTRGRTVTQVREEAALRRCLAAALPHIVARVGADDGPRLHRELAAFVDDERHAGRPHLSPPERTALIRSMADFADLVAVPLALLLLSPLLLLALPVLLLRLRQLSGPTPRSCHARMTAASRE